MVLWNIDLIEGHMKGAGYVVSKIAINTLQLILTTDAKADDTLCFP